MQLVQLNPQFLYDQTGSLIFPKASRATYPCACQNIRSRHYTVSRFFLKLAFILFLILVWFLTVS